MSGEFTVGAARAAGRTAKDAPSASSASMSSLEDSPARTLATPGYEQGSTANDLDFGESSIDSLATYDLDTSSWKTSQLCLFEGLGESLEIWPPSGMTRSGIAYLRQPLVQHMSESESGSWPTPRKQMTRGICWARVESGNHKSNIEDYVAISEGLQRGTGRWSLNPEWCEWLMGYPKDWTTV